MTGRCGEVGEVGLGGLGRYLGGAAVSLGLDGASVSKLLVSAPPSAQGAFRFVGAIFGVFLMSACRVAASCISFQSDPLVAVFFEACSLSER